MPPYHPMYETLYCLQHPNNHSKNERSLSCMKRVKTYLRSSMDDLRREDLGTLSLNREWTAKYRYGRYHRAIYIYIYI